MTFKKSAKKDLNQKSLSTHAATSISEDAPENEQDKEIQKDLYEVVNVTEEKHEEDLVIENVVETKEEHQKKDVDETLKLLTRDLENNKYFALSRNEAKKMATDMVLNGKNSLLKNSWFLTSRERQDLCDSLSTKFNIK